MAIQTSPLTYSGTIGDQVGVKRKNGKHYTRSRPKNVRQTAATRHAARRFGRASSTAAFIRKSLCAITTIQKDDGYMNRLTKTLIPAAGMELSHLVGYRFHKAKRINKAQSDKIIYLRIDIKARKAMEHVITDTPIELPGPGTWIIAVQHNNGTEIIAVRHLQAFLSYAAPQNITMPDRTPANAQFIQKE